MTNNEILILAVGLRDINPPNMNGDFNYAISTNRQEAERIAVNIREAIKESEEFAKFKKELQGLQEEYAEKDDEGKVISENIPLPNGTSIIQYSIPAARDPESDFNKKLGELDEKYKEAIDEQNNRLKFLDQENEEFAIFQIEKKDIPVGLEREQMDLILPLIKKAKSRK